jgi:hypothetical protein
MTHPSVASAGMRIAQAPFWCMTTVLKAIFV